MLTRVGPNGNPVLSTLREKDSAPSGSMSWKIVTGISTLGWIAAKCIKTWKSVPRVADPPGIRETMAAISILSDTWKSVPRVADPPGIRETMAAISILSDMTPLSLVRVITSVASALCSSNVYEL